MRLVAVVPFNVVNSAAGITAIRLRDDLAATAIGIVPGTFAFVALGTSLSDPGSPAYISSLGAVALPAVAGGGAHARRTARRRAA